MSASSVDILPEMPPMCFSDISLQLLILTCFVEGTHISCDDWNTNFDWMIESITCFYDIPV